MHEPILVNLFNADLSPKRFYRAPSSQEVGVEGDCLTPNVKSTTRTTPALKWAAMRAVLMFH